ncbi:MAG TPA: BREX system P-loop protein BrxC [Gammaproteobacteria bacterium]|nr:BREX system P-loop protein BrxC [Gammaproteobacteria bacterium]
MKIHEALARDPRSTPLANNGQARITDTADQKAQAELRAELETFVCDGQFGDALQRILGAYLTGLDKSRQDSAWVSGFFGSGKSHLLKMLTHLWLDTGFPDGATARSLVHGLPDEVAAQLRELDIQARRTGKPVVAAAGTLLGGSVDFVRHTVLSILLRATGWPAQYPQAMFCFWLRDQGLLDTAKSAVEAAGKDWHKELNNLYISPVIAQALLEADPGIASDSKGVRQVLTQQFPQLRTDITTQQFIEAARKALGPDGELPLTLLVLDEVQQYINEAQDRSAAITELAEALQTQFDSRIMLVGAGQSALSAGTQALLWLRDRFRITVELSDADVEAVTRKVLLRKKPSAVPEIEQLFESHSGEVDRHLQGTRLSARPEDRRDRVPDYPQLCTRRRFWEACFRAVDAAGSHSQLRSQLRILHDSLQKVAERHLGGVIPASDLFNALAPDMVNTGVLLNEINTRIQKLDDGTEEGALCRDLCGLVFLIGKLPREASVDLGVRANAETLADLLVADITADSGPFRRRVAETLERLATEGVLMKVGEEYRLQTTEGAEWDHAFRERRAALMQNEIEIATRRDQLFGQAVQDVLAGIKLIHGEAKLRRSLSLHAGNEPPANTGDAVVVWLRDGWSTAFKKDVEVEARRAGTEDPVLHLFLPQKSAELLRDRIVDAEAARQVLDHYGLPSTAEGREAHEGMESRRMAAEHARNEIVQEILRAARLLQGGGTEIFGENLEEKIRTGAEAALARLFPRFADADHRAWEAALKRARDGSDQPFKVVGWEGPTEDHPVAKEVLATIGAGKRGTEIQKTLKAAPYGWPQDAIDAALIALHRSGHLRASRNGQPVRPGALDQAGIKSAEFRPEKVRLTTSQRIALRGLFGKLDINTKSGEEELRAPEFLRALAELASQAGGAAPLPEKPDTHLLDELGRLAGSEQLGALYEQRETLQRNIVRWSGLADLARERLPEWQLTRELHEQAGNLPAAAEVGPELEAIEAQRSLLEETDHVAPLLKTLAAALREALVTRHQALTDAVGQAIDQLKADATWQHLAPEAQETILTQVGLRPPAPLNVATDEDLRQTLVAHPLDAWQADIDAVSERAARALQEAAARLADEQGGPQPVTVHLHRGTLADEAAVKTWLEETEQALMQAIEKGPVIIR